MSAPEYGTRRDDPSGPPFLYEAPEGWPQPDYRWMALNQLEGPYSPEGFDGPELREDEQPWFVNRPVFDEWLVRSIATIKRLMVLYTFVLSLCVVMLVVGIAANVPAGIAAGGSTTLIFAIGFFRLVGHYRQPWNFTVNEILKWSSAGRPPEPRPVAVKKPF
jgi:hypothetical protein